MKVRVTTPVCAWAAICAALPAVAQVPGSITVPEDVWPAGLEWQEMPGLGRTAETRFGTLSIVQSGGDREGDARVTEIRLDSESSFPQFAGNSYYVSIAAVAPLGGMDIVILSASSGGSGSPPPTFNLLPVGPRGFGALVAETDFRSIDGYERFAVTEDRIFFDLGFDAGLRKYAVYGQSGLAIGHFDTQTTSLKDEECWRLFSVIGSGTCILNSPASFSNALRRTLNALDQSPAFDQAVFRQVCAATRAAGRPPLYDEFNRQVCRIQP